jgi:hypothetical protein
VGISVDDAVDVAKEAADIILLEQSLEVGEERMDVCTHMRSHTITLGGRGRRGYRSHCVCQHRQMCARRV